VSERIRVRAPRSTSWGARKQEKRGSEVRKRQTMDFVKKKKGPGDQMGGEGQWYTRAIFVGKFRMDRPMKKKRERAP